MPSLQQFNHIANDSVGTSMGKTHAMRSSMSETAGTELLQKHSINSIIEQRQDFLNRHCGSSDANIMDGIHHDGGDMVSETCANAMASATQHTLSLTDPLVMTANYLDLSGNARRSCTGEKRHLANVNLNLSNHVLAIGDVGAAAKSQLHNASNASVLSKATDVFSHNATNNIMPLIGSNYMPLTPSSTQSSISPVTQTTNSFDIFQFGNIAPSLSSSPQHQHQHQSHQQQQATLTTAAAQNNALPLKAFQRNISNFDCTAPLSPSTPTSLYNNSFQSSPLVSDNSNSSPASGQPVDLMPLTYQNGCPKNSMQSTRSTSPESQNSNQSNENNLIDMMTFLNTGSTQQQQHQHKANNGEQHYEMAQFSNKKEQQKDVSQNSSYASHIADRDIVQSAKDQTLPLTAMDLLNFDNLDILSIFDMDLTKWQNLNVATILRAQQQVPLLQNLIQTYNTINQLQNWQLQQQQQQQTQVPPLLNNSINQLSNTLNNTNNTDNGSSDAYLDRIAKFYRGSAAFREPTYTWSGQLPPRSHRLHQFSPKVFLGGIPWDISEESLVQIFKPFGQIKVEWPGKELQAAQPKGYVYVIFESDKQVKALLSACVVQMDIQHNGSGLFYFKISSRRIKAKDVEVIPWWIGDSNYVKSTSQKLDPTKTVFVGALHGKLTAEGLARIMDDLFDGVVYAGIDTDKYKYPIGSGRVTFNNNRSYMKAVSAAFIEIRATKFTKKVQIDPYLEDSLCSICGVQHGPYYCRELSCFRYFCRTCWQWQHSTEAVKFHKPLTRNAKSQSLIGLGPAISTASLSSLHTHNSVNFGNLQQQPMQSHLRKQLNATRSLNSLETILQPHHQQQQPLATAATSTTPQQLQNLHNAFRL